MISSLLHLVGLRPRVYYTLTNFRGGGQGPLGPPPQYANDNGAKSERKIVTCGVPQGSILGPFFFLAYNDIFNVSDSLYNILYTDDTCLYLAGRDHCALINLMNTVSKLILHWLKVNRLTLNTSKTLLHLVLSTRNL